MKKIYLVMFAVLFISLASAYLGAFEQNEAIDVKANLNAASVNINIYFPNLSIAVNNQAMTQLKGDIWNYTFTSTSTRGIYIYDYCDENGENCKENDFRVNRLGDDLENAESNLYIFLSIAVMLLFILSLFFTIVTPYSNKINETGEVIKITKLKYVKLGFIMLDYVLLTWILNTLIGISDSFLSLTIFYGFVSFIFQTLNNLALPFGIFIIVLALFEIIKDTKIQKIINQLGSHRPRNLK